MAMGVDRMPPGVANLYDDIRAALREAYKEGFDVGYAARRDEEEDLDAKSPNPDIPRCAKCGRILETMAAVCVLSGTTEHADYCSKQCAGIH